MRGGSISGFYTDSKQWVPQRAMSLFIYNKEPFRPLETRFQKQDDEELSSNGNKHRLISSFKCQLSIGKRELSRRPQTRHKQVLSVKSSRV